MCCRRLLVCFVKPRGLLLALEHGQMAFTVPGMAGFIMRQPA